MNRNFQPSATIETLRARSELMQRVRKFFLDRGFFEVDTPLVSHDTVVDRFIDPISVDVQTPGKLHSCFLQTSPEFAMKRLVTAGAKAIFYLGKAFRQGECGTQHNPEFTILEWYRAGDDYQQGRTLLDEFAIDLLKVPPARQCSYRQIFLETTAVDPFAATADELAQTVQEKIGNTSTINDRDELLNLLMSRVVEPQLANHESVIIFDWPATQSALAKIRQDVDGLEYAERFEMYIRGIELANGYHELLDADELRRRNEFINAQRTEDGNDKLPTESRLLLAMDHGLPACSGTALGFDRLAMIALGKETLAEVVPFDFDRA